jgi:hypothetical protein
MRFFLFHRLQVINKMGKWERLSDLWASISRSGDRVVRGTNLTCIKHALSHFLFHNDRRSRASHLQSFLTF